MCLFGRCMMHTCNCKVIKYLKILLLSWKTCLFYILTIKQQYSNYAFTHCQCKNLKEKKKSCNWHGHDFGQK